MRVGIVGRNGTGKTSLLKLITGEIQPTSGEVEIAETVEFNYVDQGRMSLNPLNTVFDEIGEGNQTTFVGSDKVSVWTYLRRFLFSDERINTRIDRLSGGERARVLLARLLAGQAPLLVADEAAAGLDPEAQLMVMDIFRREAGEGRAVLTTLHDLTLAARYCDRVVVLDGGRIVADGPPRDAIRADILAQVFGLQGALADSPAGAVLAAGRLAAP